MAPRARASIALLATLAAVLLGAARAQDPKDTLVALGPPPAAPGADVGHMGERTPELLIGDALPPHQAHAHITVGITDLPPWSIPPNAETPYWSGLAALVWKQVATQLQIEYDIKVLPYPQLLDALQHGTVDLGVTGIPIVPDNIVRFSMTPPFDQSGVSIATRVRKNLSFGSVMERVLAPEISAWLLALLVFTFIFAGFFWLAERKRNPPIEGNPVRGLAESTWWSLATLSTVGYGDRVPVTRAGKIIGALWMAFGFVIMTVSAGVVTSVLTVERLQPIVTGPSELLRAKVGVVRGTTGDAYAERAELPVTRFDTLEEAFRKLEAEELDALVGSTTSLNFLAERSSKHSLVVLPRPLLRDFVGFGMRFGFDTSLEKRVELEIVKAALGGEYRAMRAVMLGENDSTSDRPR